MIIDRIKSKMSKTQNGGRLRFVYMGSAELKGLYSLADLYEHVDMSNKDAHRVMKLEIVEVHRDSHLEVL